MSDTPVVVTDMKFTPKLREIVNGALMRGRPILVTYVTVDEKPSVSFRGTVQAWGEGDLALWTRTQTTGIAIALAKHPDVALFYADDIMNPAARAMITFKGKARVDNSEAARRTVYENSPELEQKRDPDRKGTAIIIALESVTGMAPGEQYRMVNAAPKGA